MSIPLPSYHQNFITAVRLLMAKRGHENLKDVAPELAMQYMALYKVMTGVNRPSIELCIRVCELGGFSANWMFLNKGDRDLTTQISLNKIMRFLEVSNSVSKRTKKQL